MRILNVLSVFLLGTAFGSLVLLPVIPIGQVSPRFYRLFGILAAAFLMAYGFFHFADLTPLWLGALIILVCYIFTVTQKRTSVGIKIFYPLSVLSTMALFVVTNKTAFVPIGAGPLEFLLYQIDFLLSALFLGVTLMGMLLGHWYLVEPKLAIAPFKRLVAVSIGIMATRVIFIGGALVYFWATLPTGKRVLLEELFSVEGELVFLIQRVLFGVLLPVLLSWFVWNTVKIRSTQSATGILYVNLVFVLIGELLGIHLTLTTHFLM